MRHAETDCIYGLQRRGGASGGRGHASGDGVEELPAQHQGWNFAAGEQLIPSTLGIWGGVLMHGMHDDIILISADGARECSPEFIIDVATEAAPVYGA